MTDSEATMQPIIQAAIEAAKVKVVAITEITGGSRSPVTGTRQGSIEELWKQERTDPHYDNQYSVGTKKSTQN